MAGRSQEREDLECRQDREIGAEYYLGFNEQNAGNPEGDAPYKLEPSVTEIEDFLTRLRQEGL
ncbi:MAG: hypothetical protein OEZ51_07040 [Nitrospinota bacterium]|nr:hypothetical protein [Nitrospinota bacterium]